MIGKNTSDNAGGGAPGRAFSAALTALAASRRGYLARGALAVLLTSVLALLSVIFALHRLAPGWAALPIVSFVLFWAGVAAAAFGAFGRMLPLRSADWLARRIGKAAGRGSFFASALEFSRGGDRLEPYSPYLIAETTRRAGAELRRLSPLRLFGGSGRPGWIAAGLLFGVLLLVQVSFMKEAPGRILVYVVDPAFYFRQPKGFNLVVTTGNTAVLAGEDVPAEAVKFGSSRGDVILRVSAIPGIWKRVPVPPDTVESGEDVGKFAQDVPTIAYRHMFTDVQEDLRYYFQAGVERTAERRVTVSHRPVINRLGAVMTYPGYTGAPPETVSTLAGRIVALAGSEVALTGETSAGLTRGRIDFAAGGSLPLSVAPGGFRGAFTVSLSDTFTIAVVDSSGLTNEVPVRYPVVALEDRPPFIEIIAPENEALLPRSLVTDVLYRASDDYGVRRIRLRYLREGKEENFNISAVQMGGIGDPVREIGERRSTAASPGGGPVREVEGRHRWSLENAGVFPGDRILYYLEVFDNKTPPGYGRTASRRLIVPSLSEIYASIRAEESVQKDEMADVMERGREIRDRMRSFSDELRSGGELDWSRRREGDEIVEKQRALQEKIGKAAERLDRTLENLERNRMTTQEIGEKMEELQRLMRGIENEDLRRAIEKLNSMLDRVSEKEMLAALEQMEMKTEDLLQRLDRTIELLKQVMREEKMEELVRRMEDMLGEQQALRDSSQTGDTDELAERQEKLAEEYESYEEDFEKFAQEEKQSGESCGTEQCRKQMDESQIEQMMRDAAGELERGEREEAESTQNGVIDRMLSLYTSVGRCRMSMAMAMEAEVIEMLERSARGLVEISKLEETFAGRIGSEETPGWRERLVIEQLVIKGAVEAVADDLYEAARRTMSLSPAVFAHLGLSLREIGRALDGIEGGNRSQASKSAGRVYRELNRTVIEILRSSSSASQSGSNARQQMQRMLQQQLSIDQQLREMLGGSFERWSQEQRAAMARIAAEQRSMQELMKQIAEESAGTGGLLGRLDDLAGDMKEIAEQLDEGGLDDDLLRREERVLSRMLESQRSLHRRDYKRERTSRTGADLEALAPSAFEGRPDRRELLLRMIDRAMQEKGPIEYQELIRQYFRALAKKVREGE